jgi:hypothetical protein
VEPVGLHPSLCELNKNVSKLRVIKRGVMINVIAAYIDTLKKYEKRIFSSHVKS